MVEQGQYGFVVVTKGRYKGEVGLYDDDADTGKRAIVYIGTAVAYTGFFMPELCKGLFLKAPIQAIIPLANLESAEGLLTK